MKREDIYCFGCSQNNPIGLQLEFEYEENIATTTLTPRKEYEGFPGVLHGGIISTIIDEVMAKVIEHQNIYAVTVEMNVKFHKKTATEKPLTATAELISKRKKILHLKAEIVNENGEKTAEGTGKYFVLDHMKPEDLE